MGVVLGRRIGYCLFTTNPATTSHPLEIFLSVQGQHEFHGGMLNAGLKIWLPVPSVPGFTGDGLHRALHADRAGCCRSRWSNFVTASCGAMATGVLVGHGVQTAAPCRASTMQVWFLLEGLLLFFCFGCMRGPRKMGQTFRRVLFGYGVFVSLPVLPGAGPGRLALGMSMGQWLCVLWSWLGQGLAGRCVLTMLATAHWSWPSANGGVLMSSILHY
jgi:phosphatidylglycerol:prolipoprotein diacylglycerol transferase